MVHGAFSISLNVLLFEDTIFSVLFKIRSERLQKKRNVSYFSSLTNTSASHFYQTYKFLFYQHFFFFLPLHGSHHPRLFSPSSFSCFYSHTFSFLLILRVKQKKVRDFRRSRDACFSTKKREKKLSYGRRHVPSLSTERRKRLPSFLLGYLRMFFITSDSFVRGCLKGRTPIKFSINSISNS